YAEQPAVEGHSTLPDGENVQRIGEIARQVVKKHIAGATTENDTESCPDHEVVDILRLHRHKAAGPQGGIGHQLAGIPPGKENADNIADPIPMNGQGTKLNYYGVNLGEWQACNRQRQICVQDGLPAAFGCGPCGSVLAGSRQLHLHSFAPGTRSFQRARILPCRPDRTVFWMSSPSS